MVAVGPRWLSFDVPNNGKIRFKVIAGIVVKKVPKKQYLIWIRSNPIDFLNDINRKNIPVAIEEIK
jgi:hypothetical protein